MWYSFNAWVFIILGWYHIPNVSSLLFSLRNVFHVFHVFRSLRKLRWSSFHINKVPHSKHSYFDEVLLTTKVHFWEIRRLFFYSERLFLIRKCFWLSVVYFCHRQLLSYLDNKTLAIVPVCLHLVFYWLQRCYFLHVALLLSSYLFSPYIQVFLNYLLVLLHHRQHWYWMYLAPINDNSDERWPIRCSKRELRKVSSDSRRHSGISEREDSNTWQTQSVSEMNIIYWAYVCRWGWHKRRNRNVDG